MLTRTVYDFGHQQQSSPTSPLALYASSKHSTSYVVSGSESYFAPLIHPGHPGLYGVVAINNGVRSAPMFFEVVNQLKGGRIEVVTEPDPCILDAAVMLGLLARNTSATDAACGWAIGSILINQAPEVRPPA